MSIDDKLTLTVVMQMLTLFTVFLILMLLRK